MGQFRLFSVEEEHVGRGRKRLPPNQSRVSGYTIREHPGDQRRGRTGVDIFLEFGAGRDHTETRWTTPQDDRQVNMTNASEPTTSGCGDQHDDGTRTGATCQDHRPLRSTLRQESRAERGDGPENPWLAQIYERSRLSLVPNRFWRGSVRMVPSPPYLEGRVREGWPGRPRREG